MEIKETFFGTIECTNDRRLSQILKNSSYSFIDHKINSLDDKLIYEKMNMEIGFLDITGKVRLTDIGVFRGNFTRANIIDLALFAEKYPGLEGREIVLAPGDPFIVVDEDINIPFIQKEQKGQLNFSLDNIDSKYYPGYYSNVSILIKRIL